MILSTAFSRAALGRGSARIWKPASLLSAHISGYSGPAVDYDHFSHGWAVGDIGDFTHAGKYQMQTFNKISPKVREQSRRQRLDFDGTDSHIEMHSLRR